MVNDGENVRVALGRDGVWSCDIYTDAFPGLSRDHRAKLALVLRVRSLVFGTLGAFRVA